jgi:hypothetical protein
MVVVQLGQEGRVYEAGLGGGALARPIASRDAELAARIMLGLSNDALEIPAYKCRGRPLS